MMTLGVAFVALLALTAATAVCGERERTEKFVHHDEEGAYIRNSVGSAVQPSAAASADWIRHGVTATTQWHLSQSVAIYETVQLSEALAGGTAISSTRTAPPVQAALAQLSSSTGDAKALATAPNAQDVILVAAARHDASFFTAEVDVVGNSTTVTLSRFAGAGSPTWTKTFLQTSFADGSLRASDDGSHVVVALVNTTTSASSLQTFDGATGKLVATYAGFKSGDTPCCLTPFTTKGSMAGRVLVAAGATVHVVDIATGKAAWTTDRGYFNAANAISADGQYITYGFLDYSILKWSAATGTYEPAHSATAGGYIANAVAFSPSASAAILGKYNETTARHSVVEQWKLGSSGKPAVGWTYEYADVSAQPLQDTVSAMQFTDDGKQLVLCSWGTASADNPTVRVLDAQTGKLLGSFVTPGSVYDVAVETSNTKEAGDVLRVTTVGKHIHANIRGNGGDWFSLEFDLSA